MSILPTSSSVQSYTTLYIVLVNLRARIPRRKLQLTQLAQPLAQLHAQQLALTLELEISQTHLCLIPSAMGTPL
jgi:hypothetical protein